MENSGKDHKIVYYRNSTKIDFELKGDLVDKLDRYMVKGYFSSKPEVVRQALRMLFDDIESRELQVARLKTIVG